MEEEEKQEGLKELLEKILVKVENIETTLNELKAETDKIQGIVEDVDQIEQKNKSLTAIVSVNLLATLLYDFVTDALVKNGNHPFKTKSE